MINVMHSGNEPMNQVEKCLDPQLWHACAGGMAQMPPINSKVYYFPQGHAENAHINIDFSRLPRTSPIIPCKVASIIYLADSDTDEVYAKIRLIPLRGNECDDDDEVGFLGFDKNDEKEKTNSFAKTLTQSDANNGGGFSVPRYCAETIFPRLDYSSEPPVQTIWAKDVHGEIWKFRHIYRGTPRRHLLTTGWSNFVNRKKLVAGDSIVFLRAENGDLCVGIRRAKKGIGSGNEVLTGWNIGAGNHASLYGGFSGFLSENGNLCVGSAKKGNGSLDMGMKETRSVRAESVIEAVSLAANGQPFEVVYYPRASTPEFVVKASAVRTAMRVQWCSGMRFKMAFETEDLSRISWFMGTISTVQVADLIHWPNSPWRLLQVAWDEPDLLQNVRRISPWLAEVVSNVPGIHISAFSPPRKRPRLPQSCEFTLGILPMPTVVSNPLSPISPLCHLPDSISAGIQGARHAQFGLHTSILDYKRLKGGLQPFDFMPLDYAGNPLENPNFGALSCSEKTGSSAQNSAKNNQPNTNPAFLLFGQPILTEQQISQNCSLDNGGISLSDANQDNTANDASNGSGSAVIQNCPPEASSDEEFPIFQDWKLEFGFETRHHKTIVEAEDVSTRLAHAFANCSNFMKNSRRPRIHEDSGSVNLRN